MTPEPTSSFHHCELCRTEDALALLRGKWAVPVLCRIAHGPKRFNELQRLLPGIRHKVLTSELRQLERDRMVRRTVLAEAPVPAVEYALTPFGQEVASLVHHLDGWAREHLPPDPSVALPRT